PIRPGTRRSLRKTPEPKDCPNGPIPATRPDFHHQTEPDHYVACGLPVYWTASWAELLPPVCDACEATYAATSGFRFHFQAGSRPDKTRARRLDDSPDAPVPAIGGNGLPASLCANTLVRPRSTNVDVRLVDLAGTGFSPCVVEASRCRSQWPGRLQSAGPTDLDRPHPVRLAARTRFHTSARPHCGETPGWPDPEPRFRSDTSPDRSARTRTSPGNDYQRTAAANAVPNA